MQSEKCTVQNASRPSIFQRIRIIPQIQSCVSQY